MKLIMALLLAGSIASCSSSPQSESAGQYVDSSAASAKIKTELLSDDLVSGTSIDVETYKGTVILSGFVDSEAEKERAVEIAESMKGVRDVEEALIVKRDVEGYSE